MNYLGNAFSLQMLESLPSTILVEEVSKSDIPEDVVSVIGHEDIARLVGYPVNRVSNKFTSEDTLYVAQYVGGRLPEGVTKLPDNAEIKFIKVNIIYK